MIIKTIESSKLNSTNAGLNPQDAWESLKSSIKEATQSNSKQRAKRVANQCNILENKLSKLYKLQDNNQNSDNITQNEIRKVENELSTFYDYKAKGAQIRTQAEWIETARKPRNIY